jgi:hypothetical protein
MILYNPDLEKFTDGVEFDSSRPCIWVVYPAGGAGDLLASIINFHFVETGAKFRGISKTGQVIFRPSDQKYSNQLHLQGQLEFNDQFFFKIADLLSSINLNWSKMDQFIFSNHCYRDADLEKILNKFENCKIIQLLPKTLNEQEIVNWLEFFKNRNVAMKVPVFTSDSPTIYKQHSDQRVLTISFSDLIRATMFESTYQSILAHLSLPCAAVSYEFVQFWIDQQDSRIQEYIVRLTQS